MPYLSPYLDDVPTKNLRLNSHQQGEDIADHPIASEPQPNSIAQNTQQLIQDVLSQGLSSVHQISLPLGPLFCHLIK